MWIRPRNYFTACAPRAIVLCSVGSLTFNASHFSHTPSHSNSAPRPWISQPTNRTPDSAHHTPRTTHQREACPSRTLPNNVARNSPRSFFDYASKRCNSNTANSKFEIVARELRATLIEQARRRPTAPHGTRRQAGPQAPRQGPRVRRHREPRRLVTTVNAATASSIEESGPALHQVPGPSTKRQSSEMGVTP